MENSSKLRLLADNYLSAGKAERNRILAPYSEDDQRTIVIKAIGFLLKDYKDFKAKNAK